MSFSIRGTVIPGQDDGVNMSEAFITRRVSWDRGAFSGDEIVVLRINRIIASGASLMGPAETGATTAGASDPMAAYITAMAAFDAVIDDPGPPLEPLPDGAIS